MICSRAKHIIQYLKRLDMDITLRPYDAATQTLIAVMYLAELVDGKTYNNIKVMKSTLEG